MSFLSRTIQGVLASSILLAALPQPSEAQFGKLKKLKNAISPDSAAKAEAALKDSIALAEKLAAGDTTPLQRSKLSRAVSAATAASQKFEEVTGVSAKDAALAATGVGASNLVAKKLGVDPMSIGAQAINAAKNKGAGTGSIGNAAVNAAMRGMPGASGVPSMAGMPGMAGMPNMAELMKMQQAAGQMATSNATTRDVPNGAYAYAGFTEADARALAAFQQEMMIVAMAAGNGDAAAQARLERWEQIALKYQPEIEKLSLTASAGDMASVQRLHAIQVSIIREWANTGDVKPAKTSAPAKTVKGKKP